MHTLRLSSFLLAALLPHQAEAPTLAAANARLAANDARGAATILEDLIERQPENGPAWKALGGVLLTLADAEMATHAFERALELQPEDASLLYSLGVARARNGDADGAFAWLGRARASRRVDMTQIDFDARLSSLASDARFAGLRPDAELFARPFVEDVKLLGEWRGEGANDQFGWIARGLGDVDGDGVTDFATSAPTRGPNSAGRVYVYSTKSGRLLWSADGRAGDRLGSGLEAAGDTNGDGVPDVIAGAPGGGRAVVYSGRDGRVLLALSAEGANEAFGQHAAGVGDANHDGYADVIVGAPGHSGAGPGAGRAMVFSGKDGSALLVLSGEAAQDAFGSAVTGHTRGDETLLVVGAGGGGAARTGCVYVYSGLSERPKFRFEADATGVAFGQMFVGVPGDVDGDGALDVYTSDWPNAARGPQTGRAYVFSGKDGRNLLTLTGEAAGDGLGSSQSTAGDVDGDGRADLLVGAWQVGTAAIGAGATYLHSGADGKRLASYTCRTPGDAFGFDAVGLGDVDGDGTSDFLVTSGWSGANGYHAGRVLLFSSGILKKGP